MAVGATMESAAATIDDDLNALRSQVKRLAGTANWYDLPSPAGAGWIYITDVSVPGGTVSDKVWQDDPANTVLQSATVSDADVLVTVRASYPLVDVGGTPAELTRDGVAGGHYSGIVAVTLPGSGDLEATVLTPDGDNGATDTIALTLDAPPNVTSATFTDGTYPGAQTEVNADQTMQLQVVADKEFDRVVIANFEAGAGQTTVVVAVEGPPGVWTASVAVDIADRGTSPITGQAARVSVRDAGTLATGPTYDTDAAGTVDLLNVLTLNNGSMGPALTSISYPIGQSAIKGVETADVVHTLADAAGTVAYVDPTGTNISIPAPTVFAGSKTVTCLNPLLFNNSSTNFRLTTTKSSNGKVAVLNVVVVVADVAPSITVTEPAARLRSGGNNGTAVQAHTITLTSSQPLAAAPTLNADSGGQRGTFAGVWAGGPTVWTRVLSVNETLPDQKGTFTWEGLVATGLAGLVQNTITGNATYVLGGFVSRDLTFAAFTATTTFGTSVVDFSKLTAGVFTATNSAALKQNIGTAPPVTNGYTIDALATDPTTLTWLDTAQVGANASGTAQILSVQETV